MTTPSPDTATVCDENMVTQALGRLARGFTHLRGEILLGDQFDSGTVAALRHADFDNGTPLAVFQVLYRALSPAQQAHLLPDNDDDRPGRQAGRAWGLVLHGMALMAPLPHEPEQWPGVVLAETDFSETRLIRLLRADGEEFPAVFATTCRFLRTKGRSVDWTHRHGLGHFALKRCGAPGIPGATADMADRIARDFVKTTSLSADRDTAHSTD